MTAPAAPDSVAPDEATPNGTAPHAALRWLRAAGALLFWGSVQGVFLVPATPPGAGPYRPLIPPAAGVVLNLLVAAGFVWWFALRPRARRDAARRSAFRLRPPPEGAWPRVALAAFGAGVAVNAATLVLPRFFPLPPENWLIEGYGRVPGGAAALFVLAAVVAPLLEEFLFRGWLQGRLERRLASWPAILAASGLFALLHGTETFGLVPRFGLAVAAGYAAWATGSIWPCVVLHGAYNAALFVGAALLPDLLPAVPAMEGWGDAERAQFFYWARDPRVFGPAAGVLVAAAGVAAWALARVPRRVAPAELVAAPSAVV